MIRLRIEGMSCQHCINAVSTALADVPGVDRVVAVELAAGSAEVEGTAEPKALVDAIREEGYEAEVV